MIHKPRPERRHSTRLARVLRLAPILLALTCIAPALAHDVSREVAALQERVEDLQANELVLQSQIRQVGGSATTSAGIAGAEWRIRHDQKQITELQSVAALYGRSVEEMREITRQYQNSPVFTVSDVAQEGGEQAAEKAAKAALEAGGRRVATRALGIASIVGDVVEHGGKLVIRAVDSHRLRQEALAEHIHLNEVLGTIVQFQREIAADYARIRQLRDLQQQFSTNNDALASANLRLRSLTGHAHDDADTRRVTDAAGDEALARQGQRSSIRLCDPSQKHRPVGIRPAQKASRTATAAGKEKLPTIKTEEPVAEGDACRDITGLWTLQQSIQVHGKNAPMGPPLRAEIVRADGDATDAATPRYEVFGPSKAAARNGPLMRCTRTGHALACQRRVQQQACPAGKYVWAPLQLTVATDVSSISGELRQSYLMDPRNDPSGCTVVAGEGQGTIGFRLVPAKL